MSTRINIDARPHEVEEVFLGDDGPFEFVSPKAGRLMSAVMIDDPAERDAAALRAQVDWLRDGFTEEDWDHITERLDDPMDPLDWSHLIGDGGLVQSLTEKQAKRPPTSRGGSSGTPRTNGSGAAQRRRASTFGDSPSDGSAT